MLAERGYFQPGTGCHHQQLQGGGLQFAIVAAVGINQGRYLILESEGQYQHACFGGIAEMLYERATHFGDIAGSGDSILVCVRDRPGGNIESKVLHDLVIAESAGLPARSGPSFYDEQGDARAIGTAGFQQSAQNFLLAGACMNSGYGVDQSAGVSSDGTGLPRRVNFAYRSGIDSSTWRTICDCRCGICD